jgi:hypothetical protein|tara:strand:- start:635 stop:1015 length:381 start_codon:yes stop_codon:yes gene_type:complete
MPKPSDYPPVKDMDISAVEDLLIRLKLEKATENYNKNVELEEFRINAIKERGIPEFLEPRETRKSITEIRGKYFPKEDPRFPPSFKDNGRERWLTDKDYMILLFEGLFWSGSIPLMLLLFAYALLV